MRSDAGRLIVLLVAVSRCGGDGVSEIPEPTARSRSVTQGGAQDIAQFRAVVGRGEVPSSAMLEEVGFFNEHALDLPPADCGAALCLHPMLAVAPRFNDANWTMAFVAMNTAVDPKTLPAGPRHLILVVEQSTAVAEVMSFRAAAQALRPGLAGGDLWTLIVANGSPRVQALARPPEELASHDVPQPRALAGQPPPRSEPVDLYGALALAFEVSASPPLGGHRQQVLLFSSGQAGAGIKGRDAFEGLARRFSEQGVVVSSFGMGTTFRRELPRVLTDLTSGNSYFAESANDLGLAVTVAGETGFVPLARNLRLTVKAAPGYRVGAVYGAGFVSRTVEQAVLEAPTLFIGTRTSARDVGTGRRGGGGGFFVELIADVPPGRAPIVRAPACEVTAEYVDQLASVPRNVSLTLATPLGVGNNPKPTDPFFSDNARAKPFMMLNMYLALRAAVALYELDTCGYSLGIEDMMAQSYAIWQATFSDPDIAGDWNLLQALVGNIKRKCTAPMVRPVNAPVSCFWS